MKRPRLRWRPVESDEPTVQRNATAIMARLEDGPMAGRTVEAHPVEGRPPKTIDVPAHDGDGAWRYCLEGWEQEGHTAAYTFLYKT
jgi:hypothetical protein